MDGFNLNSCCDFDDLVAADGLPDGPSLQLQPDFGCAPLLLEYHHDMEAFLNHVNHLQLNNTMFQEVHAVYMEHQDLLPAAGAFQFELSTPNVNIETLNQPSVLRSYEQRQPEVTIIKQENTTPKNGDTGPFACDECEEQFESKSRLATHKKKAHCKEKKCEACGRFFKNNMVLYLHTAALHPEVDMDYDGLESDFANNSSSGQRKSTKRSSKVARREAVKVKKLENDNGLQNPKMSTLDTSNEAPVASSAPPLVKVDDSVDDGIDLELPDAVSILGKRKLEATGEAAPTSETESGSHEQNSDEYQNQAKKGRLSPPTDATERDEDSMENTC